MRQIERPSERVEIVGAQTSRLTSHGSERRVLIVVRPSLDFPFAHVAVRGRALSDKRQVGGRITRFFIIKYIMQACRV